MSRRDRHIKLIAGAPIAPDEENNRGIALLFQFRGDGTFQEYLQDWMKAHDCTDLGAGSFIHKTGLDHFLDVNDWRKLSLGTAAPDRKLGRHLIAAMLTDAIYLESKPWLANKRSFKLLCNHADSAFRRIEQKIHPKDDELAAFRQSVAYSIYKKILRTATTPPQKDRASGPQTAKIDITQILMKKLRGMKTDEFFECCAATLNSNRHALEEMVRQNISGISDQQINRWIENEIEPYFFCHSGKLLKFFRQCMGLSHEDLGAKIGDSSDYIGKLERGEKNISRDYLTKIGTRMGLQQEEYNLIVKSRFPGLDSDWLETQPTDQQAGILLHDVRECLGLTQKDVCGCVGGNRGTYQRYNYENGGYFLPFHLEALLRVIKKYDAALPTKPINQHIFTQEHEAVLRKHVVRFKALDSRGLKKVTSGLLLRTIREGFGWTAKELGGKLGVGETTILNYERGSYPVPPHQATVLIHTFLEADPERHHFSENVERKFLELTGLAYINADLPKETASELLEEACNALRVRGKDVARKIAAKTGSSVAGVSSRMEGTFPIRPQDHETYIASLREIEKEIRPIRDDNIINGTFATRFKTACWRDFADRKERGDQRRLLLKSDSDIKMGAMADALSGPEITPRR